MNWIGKFLRSSIVKKQTMAITGLLLCGFLVAHLAGNLTLLGGAEAFNLYAYKLHSLGPLLYLAEAGLVALFLIHLTVAVKLTAENNMARPQKYYVKVKSGRGETFAAATMKYTGPIILIFLILHLLHFKFGEEYTIVHNGVEMRDLYRTVIEYFQSRFNVLWYVVAMSTMALHVSHGFWSAFQSLGWHHPKYTPFLQKTSTAFAVVVGLGFAFLAVFCHFQGGQ